MKFVAYDKTCINLNIGYDNNATEEVLTVKSVGLQTDKSTLIHYPQTKFSMLCHEDSHTNVESR
jgi:hypothetical protein